MMMGFSYGLWCKVAIIQLSYHVSVFGFECRNEMDPL